MGIKINKVYTRSGDEGETGLVGGARVAKCDPRVASFGDVDELNSVLGLVKAQLKAADSESELLKEVIEYIQQELFDLGSELATPPNAHYPTMWHAAEEHILNLEKLCDHYSAGLPELPSFILPGGSSLAAVLHIARCVARRAERTLVALQMSLLAQGQPFNGMTLRYLNRLSDLLFILARWTLAQEGKNEPLWRQSRERRLPTLK